MGAFEAGRIALYSQSFANHLRFGVQCTVRFPPQWIDITRFERALLSSCGPHDAGTYQVIFEFPVGCKIMVDAATRLLSLINQLASTTRTVLLDFQEGRRGDPARLLAPVLKELRHGHA